MIRRLEQSHDHVIGYSIAGEVSEDEYTQAASELRDAIARHGKIRVLFRLSDLSLSAFFTALGDRFRFLGEHQEDIERVAFVTDDTATSMLTKTTQVLPSIETDTFPSQDEAKAWTWLE
jgi:hypothetical protein